jgi:hypothetical protein
MALRRCGFPAVWFTRVSLIVTLLLTLFLPAVILAGAPEIMWQVEFASTYDSRIWGIDVTDDGGAIAVGETGTEDPDLESLFLVKLTPQGEVQWETVTGWGLSTSGQDVIQVPGGYIVCGYINTPSGTDGFLARFDYFGTEVWSQCIDKPDDEALFDIAEVPGGLYVAAGYTESTGAGGKDFWLVMVDGDGEVLWTRTYGTSGSEVAYSVEPLSTGGFALCGGSDGNFHMVLTDEDGIGLFSRSFDQGGHETARCILESSEGGYLLVGSTMEEGDYQTDTWLLRTDASGNELWDLILGGENTDSGWDAVEPVSGGFVVLSNTMSAGSGSYDASLTRLDPWGNVIWTVLAGDSCWNTASGLSLGETGDLVMGGRSWNQETECYDTWVVKTGPEDLLNWP